MRKILLIVFAIFVGFLQAQTKKQTTTKQKTEKKWVNPVKLSKEERSRPYMDEVLKTRDSLTPQEAERRRKNIAVGNPFAKYGVYPKIATLSKGKYLEFHDMDSVVSIGSVRYNRKSKFITEFREIDLSNPDAQPYLDTAGRWISPDPLSEEFPSWSPYNIGYNNPISNIDPDGRAAFDWVHNRETNSVYWNPNATSQSTAGTNETYLGKSGTYTTTNGSTTALNADGSYTNNSLLGGLGLTTNLDPLIHAGDSAPMMSMAIFGDPNSPTISATPDSRGKTQLQSLVAENPLVQDAVIGAVTGGALNTLLRSVKGAETMTTLYRSVSPAELADIGANGLRMGETGYATEKLFTTTAKDASFFSKSFFPWDKTANTIIRAKVPSSIMQTSGSFIMDGKSVISIPANQLQNIKNVKALSHSPIP
ncbi:hypothetical protein [Chryseobacterium sp.]|uniref:hypothetical protein n=1 Tax=Chryseobacterium sp. TaxID=1871047 RepID=UPI002355BAC1|nr:hypothetical protein [Chryseobacterium sp.]